MEERKRRTGTRDRILAAALECFDRRGIGDTGMEDIADAAGLTRPALYYYFDGKRELIHEVLIEVGTRIIDQLSAELANATPGLETVITAIVRTVEVSLEDPVVLHLVAPEGERLTGELLRSDRMRTVHTAFWTPLLEGAVAAGELRPDLDHQQVIAWIVFLSLSLCSAGAAFGLMGERLRPTVETFVGPALGR